MRSSDGSVFQMSSDIGQIIYDQYAGKEILKSNRIAIIAELNKLCRFRNNIHFNNKIICNSYIEAARK